MDGLAGRPAQQLVTKGFCQDQGHAVLMKFLMGVKDWTLRLEVVTYRYVQVGRAQP